MPLIAREDPSRPDVSVIVPLHTDGARFRRCLQIGMTLPTRLPYELIVVTDEADIDLPQGVVHVTTGLPGPTSPAIKRDVGGKHARGEIFAFIDDDAYPGQDWLDAAWRALQDPTLDGVGGPGLTPPGLPWRERLGGAVYESWLGSGPLRYRFTPGRARDEDDLPAYNLFLRRKALESIGGWNSTFYGGEDTKVCLELVSRGFRLRYEPDVVVYHYRRPVMASHLRQVANVGRHRGFFAKRYPATSRRVAYALPAIGALGLIPIAWLTGRAVARRPVSAVFALGSVWLATAASAYPRVGPSAIAFPAALVAHHVAYGVSFLRGLMLRDLST